MHVLKVLGETKHEPRATAFVGLRDAARRRDNNKLMVPRYKSEGPERPRRRGSPFSSGSPEKRGRRSEMGTAVPFAYRRSTDCASAPRRNRNRTDVSGSGRAFFFYASFICDNGPARCGLS